MMNQQIPDGPPPWEEYKPNAQPWDDYKPATPWDDYKPVTPLPTHVRNHSPVRHPHPDSHLHPECFRNEDCGCPCNWNEQGGMDCEGTVCCPYCNRQVRGCKRCGYVDPCDCSSARNMRTNVPMGMMNSPNMIQNGNPIQLRSNLIPASSQTSHIPQEFNNQMPPNNFCGQCIHDQNNMFAPQLINNQPPPPQTNMMNPNSFPACNMMPSQPQNQQGFGCFNQPNGQMMRCNRPNCTTCYPAGFSCNTPTQGIINMQQNNPNAMFQPQPQMQMTNNAFPMSSMQSPMMTCQMPVTSFDF